MSETAERPTVFISDVGHGVGRIASEKLLSRGYIMGAFGTSGDQKWAADHQNAVISAFDITNPQQWEDTLKQFVDGAGRLDVLISNTDILHGIPFEEGSYKQNSVLIDINVRGVYFGCRTALPYLKDSYGQVINLCPALAIYDTPDMAVYSTTKFAVHSITGAFEVEWEPHGIDVKAAWLLYINTPMFKNVNTDGTKRMGIRTMPDDVTNAIAGYIDHKQGKITKVHFLVGLQTKLLYYTASVDAPFLNRLINAELTTKRKIGF